MDETVLLKKKWRSDGIWTNPLIYRSFLKLIPLYFDTRSLMRSQYWSREKIEHLQDERLKELLDHAVRVPFWRERLNNVHKNIFTSPLEMLSRVPIITKKDLADKSLDYIANLSLLNKSNPDHTSGSTGKPFHFYQDWHASLRSYAITERIFRTTGKRYPIVYIRTRERNGFTFYKHIWFGVQGYNSIRYRIDDFIKLGQQLRDGFILYGYTSWVIELTRQLENLSVQLPIRATVVAGEHITGPDRAYIERALTTKLFTLYASREVGFLGYECELRKMHINEEWAYIEIADRNGLPVPAGHEGRIIVTTFDNRVMPFIRYEIGDVGAISKEPCECGRALRILTFRGRSTEIIELEDDRVVSLLDISYALGSYRDTVRQYQIIQKSKKSFVIRVVSGPLFEMRKESLESLIVGLLHPRVQISWEVTDAIPEAKSGKAIYFVRDFQHHS